MSHTKARGALIILEGCDRTGKTTQARLLTKALTDKGKKAEFLRFPERSSQIGKLIDTYLTGKEELEAHVIHLLFSANRWEHVNKIRKYLDAGTSLIVDRYAFSGAAYSAMKQGLSLDWCKQSDAGLPKPDKVLFLDLPSAQAENRGDFGTEIYEKSEIQQKVYDNYMALKDHTWEIIDANRSVEELQSHLLQEVEKTINLVKTKPIETLWS